MLTTTQKLYFSIFFDFFKCLNIPSDIIRYIIEFVKYDKLTDQTIRQAVRDYCLYDLISPDPGMKKFAVLFSFGPINSWNTSCVTRLFKTFENIHNFNEDISEWDVSNVVSMYGTFHGATSFNGDLSKWDVSNVVTMYGMFHGATSFNGDISGWNVSNVKFMENMFRDASSFNGDLSRWNVSNVRTMSRIFCNAIRFDSNISEWNVISVEYMSDAFYGATNFQCNLTNWGNKICTHVHCTDAFTDSGIDNENLPTWYKNRLLPQPNPMSGFRFTTGFTTGGHG